MKAFATFAGAAFMAAGIVALSPAPASAYSSPVTVISCTITKPKPMSDKASGTDITYINHGPKTAKSIKFAVSYVNAANPKGLLRTVIDEGTFSPGVTIKKHYPLYSDVTYSGANTRACEAVKIVWSDGTTWVASR